MTTENDISKILSATPKPTSLRRSVSTTGLGLMCATNLNLRDTKSYTSPMEDENSSSSRENTCNEAGEIICNEGIETKDVFTNDVLMVHKDALHWNGKFYTLNDIAYLWKKDWRIWLWKNNLELRKHKSVGEKLKMAKLKNFI